MKPFRQELTTIFGDKNLYIELTYYPETLPPIRSYYNMTLIEYEELKSLHMDLYIEDFLNDENLTRDKLDIHILNNKENINILEKFMQVFQNPFDILGLINSLKNRTKHRTNIKKKEKEKEKEKEKGLGKLLLDQLSDIDDDSFENSSADLFSEPIIRPNTKSKSKSKSKLKSRQIIEDKLVSSDSDSEDYIETMTEIIETYNKSKKIDESNLNKLALNKPELLKDTIIAELQKKI